ncbi:MAG: hypothetical protein US18_C0008G0012 [Parcubacteria group bacterium GW2011_GWB1_36_5]|nr:MAG: hypothetical protein US12_C0023G0005 [Parcubacteria group bacterium GW2011_GWA2_36_24]KKQ07771.1 MAG: hypothetical protein US18_C0008G0012 [Parcubacteria group bacterium GW2011_GWB1_36_5]
MITIIEGVDGTGKSTLCQNLVRNLGGIVYATPPKILTEERKKIDRFSSPQESFAFYSRGIEIAFAEINQLSKLHRCIFVDRYWISTVATHLALGAKIEVAEMVKYEDPNFFTVFLTINIKKQSLRFSKRGMTDGDQKLLKHFDEVQDNFCRLIKSHCRSHLVVDTSEFSEIEVCSLVLKYLKPRL